MATSSAAPLVSIVTPTLNQGQFIEATLRSVMRQTYPAVEHIVVDGGSNDGTTGVLQAYESRYRMHWSSASDTGMYDAINKGLRQARGEILAYLNSDDVYLPWTIEVVADTFRRHPDVQVLFGDALIVDQANARAEIGFNPAHRSGYLLRNGHLCQPTVFWRRQAYEAAGEFDSQLGFIGDHEYWLRLGRQFRLVKLDELLAVERRHQARKSVVQAEALRHELVSVRRLYEHRSRPIVAILTAYGLLRTWAWRRAMWIHFMAAWLRPGTNSGAWSRTMAAAKPRLSWIRVLALQAPLVGRRRTLVSRVARWPDGWIADLLGNWELPATGRLPDGPGVLALE